MSRIIRHTNLRKGGLCSCIVNSKKKKKKKLNYFSGHIKKLYTINNAFFFFSENTERDISMCEYKLNIY